jgi:NAD-dependent deacetylase
MTSSHDGAIAAVEERLRSARRITALTGAGVSAASGIPTFRGADGLWKKMRAETIATPEAFENDPRLVWEWYDWRRQLIAAASPNAAHDVLAGWTRERPGFTLITQNVEGLHERAGAERLTEPRNPRNPRNPGTLRSSAA